MKRRGRRGSKTEDFTNREGVLAFVDQLMPDVKQPKGTRELARSRSNGATGGAIKSLDDRIRRIAAQSVMPESKIRTIEDNAQAVKRLSSSVSALEDRVEKVTEQSNKTLGMLGDLLQKFNDYKKEVEVKFKKLEKDITDGASGGGLGSMLEIAGDLAGAKGGPKATKGGAVAAVGKAPAAATPAVVKNGLMKSIGSMAAKGGARIPLVGGLIEGVSEFIEGGDLGRSIAAGAGTVLGGLIGGALGTVVAPGVGTAVGGIGGSMAGAELARGGYDLIFGKKAPKESQSIREARSAQESASGPAQPSAGPAAVAVPGSPPPATSAAGLTITPSTSTGSGGGVASLPAGGQDSEANKKIFINAMNEAGVKSNEERAAMAAVIMGESGFTLRSETSYSNTPNGRIRTIFGSSVQALNDAQLEQLKKNDEAFFNRVYGGRLGNSPNEGFKYRGRGFIQLTGKGNYEKYSRVTGVDLVSNPDLANDPAIAAKVAAIYMMKTRGPGGSVYEQIARGVGNPVAETEAVKKQAYAQFVSSGEFSSDKAGQAPQQAAGGEAGGGQTAVQQEGGGTTPPAAGIVGGGGAVDAAPVQKESPIGMQQGKGRDFSDSARKLNFAPGVDPNINEGIMQKIAGLESSFGKLTITSGYRDPQRNASAGGAKNSAHMRKNAVDVTFSGDERKTLELVQMASKAGIGGIGVYAPGRVHLDTESRRVWGPSFGPESIPQWARAALQAHMSGQWGQYDAAAAGQGPSGGRESPGGGSGRVEGSQSIPAGQGVSRAQGVPITSTGMTSRAQMPGGGGISGTIARAPGMGPLAGILGGMNLGKMPQMPSFGGGLLGGALGGIGNAILGQATSMIGGQISGAIMGPGGIGGSTIGGKLLGGLLGPGTGAMIGPIMSAAGRGDARTLAGPQPMNALMGMIGGMIQSMTKGAQPQQRNPNMQFTPDSYQDSNVPRAMPPSSMMKELFGYDIAGGYYPQR